MIAKARLTVTEDFPTPPFADDINMIRSTPAIGSFFENFVRFLSDDDVVVEYDDDHIIDDGLI